MRTPKKWLQKWLGIEAIAKEVAELRLMWTPTFMVDQDNSRPLTDEEKIRHYALEENLRERDIVKGYDKP